MQNIAACCKLHNFIADNASILNVPTQSCGVDDSTPFAVDRILHLQDEWDTEVERLRPRRDFESSTLRDKMTLAIRDEVLTMPVV